MSGLTGWRRQKVGDICPAIPLCVFTTCTVETHTDAESVAKRTSRKEVEPRDDPREKKSTLSDATGVWIVVQLHCGTQRQV